VFNPSLRAISMLKSKIVGHLCEIRGVIAGSNQAWKSILRPNFPRELHTHSMKQLEDRERERVDK
jgi:hypothetical protein